MVQPTQKKLSEMTNDEITQHLVKCLEALKALSTKDTEHFVVLVISDSGEGHYGGSLPPVKMIPCFQQIIDLYDEDDPSEVNMFSRN